MVNVETSIFFKGLRRWYSWISCWLKSVDWCGRFQMKCLLCGWLKYPWCKNGWFTEVGGKNERWVFCTSESVDEKTKIYALSYDIWLKRWTLGQILVTASSLYWNQLFICLLYVVAKQNKINDYYFYITIANNDKQRQFELLGPQVDSWCLTQHISVSPS